MDMKDEQESGERERCSTEEEKSDCYYTSDHSDYIAKRSWMIGLRK